jgi:Restriction endonuclease
MVKSILFLYRLSDLPITKYRSRSPDNPYIQGEWSMAMTLIDSPLPEQVWVGNAENSQWRELKETIIAERGAKCEICGSTEKLDLHHIKARKCRGKDVVENLQLLCRKCHAQTPSFGRRK